MISERKLVVWGHNLLVFSSYLRFWGVKHFSSLFDMLCVDVPFNSLGYYIHTVFSSLTWALFLSMPCVAVHESGPTEHCQLL